MVDKLPLDINQNNPSSDELNIPGAEDLSTPIVENPKQGDLWAPENPKQEKSWGPGSSSTGFSDDDITPTVEQIPYINLQVTLLYIYIYSYCFKPIHKQIVYIQGVSEYLK